MKQHTTNYVNTFIQVADDCPAMQGEFPPLKGESKSVANIQFDIIKNNPYQYTSDEVVFAVYAEKNDISDGERKAAWDMFFSKGQPCLRASPLTKRYGWGIHYNAEGKMAIYGADSPEYARFSADKNLKVIKAMRTSKK